MELGKFFGRFFEPAKQPERPQQRESTTSIHMWPINRAAVARAIEERQHELDQDSSGYKEGVIKKYTEGAQEVSPEVIEGLAHMKTQVGENMETNLGQNRKFVREGERIVIAPVDINHPDIAIFGNMRSPDDAGFIERPSGKESLIVKRGSSSLKIEPDNENREATVKLLQTLAPNVEIVYSKY